MININTLLKNLISLDVKLWLDHSNKFILAQLQLKYNEPKGKMLRY